MEKGTRSLRRDGPERTRDGSERTEGADGSVRSARRAAAVRPRPAADRDSAYWWEAVKDRRFLIQHCADCRTPRFPPREVCAVCLSLEWEWREGTGTGKVDGWTVTRRTFHPAFAAPYTVLRVALDDGPALYCWGVLVDADPSDLRRGLPVEAVFTEPPPEAERAEGAHGDAGHADGAHGDGAHGDGAHGDGPPGEGADAAVTVVDWRPSG